MSSYPVVEITLVLDPHGLSDNARIMARAELDNDQTAMELYFAERPDGDWLSAGWETRMEYRRVAYFTEEIVS